MNRRQFFGMTAAAVAAAGLPALVLPERTTFLPPRLGWFQPPMRMREVQQYFINEDALAMRWDMAWITALGEYEQHYYALSTPRPWTEGIPEELRTLVREDVRAELIAKIPRGARMVELELPRTVHWAAYV